MIRWFVGCLVACASSGSYAAEFKPWRTVGHWNVTRNVQDQACQITSAFDGEGETVLSLTYIPSTDTARLMVGNTGWQSLKDGDNPSIDINFGAAGKWTEIETKSVVTDTYHWLTMSLDGRDFLRDFAVSTSIHISRGDTVVDKLDLKGSRAAVSALSECALGINKGIARDPFE